MPYVPPSLALPECQPESNPSKHSSVWHILAHHTVPLVRPVLVLPTPAKTTKDQEKAGIYVVTRYEEASGWCTLHFWRASGHWRALHRQCHTGLRHETWGPEQHLAATLVMSVARPMQAQGHPKRLSEQLRTRESGSMARAHISAGTSPFPKRTIINGKMVFKKSNRYISITRPI